MFIIRNNAILPQSCTASVADPYTPIIIKEISGIPEMPYLFKMFFDHCIINTMCFPNTFIIVPFDVTHKHRSHTHSIKSIDERFIFTIVGFQVKQIKNIFNKLLGKVIFFSFPDFQRFDRIPDICCFNYLKILFGTPQIYIPGNHPSVVQLYVVCV